MKNFFKIIHIYIGEKKILFSSLVEKINTSLKIQNRCILISEKSLYIMNPKNFSFKRKLDIKHFVGIFLSTMCDGIKEKIIIVIYFYYLGYIVILTNPKNFSYDLILNTDKRTEIITVITTNYQKITKKNLLFHFSDKYYFYYFFINLIFNRIEYRSRKGKKEISFQKGDKNMNIVFFFKNI